MTLLRRAICLWSGPALARPSLQKRFLISGGGAPEMELSYRLSQWARELQGMEAYCVR